jgi:biotin carboxyl carrier protein
MRKFKLNIIGKSYDIEVESQEIGKFIATVNGKRYKTSMQNEQDKTILMAVDGGLYSIEIEGEPSTGKMQIKVNNRERMVESKDLLSAREITSLKKPISTKSKGELFVEDVSRTVTTGTVVNGILAPMPGKVVSVKVNAGDDVKAGDVVIILEAMKMENEITSNRDGKITEVRVKDGDSVDADDIMVVIG